MTLNDAAYIHIMVGVGRWMESKQLKLNEDKTECLVVGKQNDLRRLDISTLQMNNTIIEVNNEVKDLGILIDCNLSFLSQIKQVTKIAGYHHRNKSFVRKYLSEQSMKMLIHNYVLRRLDYCKSQHFGLPNYLLRKLQLVMNQAARLIKGLSSQKRIHVP